MLCQNFGKILNFRKDSKFVRPKFLRNFPSNIDKIFSAATLVVFTLFTCEAHSDDSVLKRLHLCMSNSAEGARLTSSDLDDGEILPSGYAEWQTVCLHFRKLFAECDNLLRSNERMN